MLDKAVELLNAKLQEGRDSGKRSMRTANGWRTDRAAHTEEAHKKCILHHAVKDARPNGLRRGPPLRANAPTRQR